MSDESRWYEYPGHPLNIKGATTRIHYGSGTPLLLVKAPRELLDRIQKEHDLKRRYPIDGV
jgi:hypothetical protein